MIVCARKPQDLPVACCLVLASASMLDGQPKIVTWHNDNARTGQNLSETILTPANVRAASFGKLFVLAVDGKVDAQPLYVPALSIPGQGTHNVLYVETEHDTAYAFDGDNGALLKQVSLIGSGETTSDDRGCDQVTPEIGITATPVIDPAMGPHGTVYVVAMTKDQSGNYHQRLHALDLTTLAEEFSGPVEIAATYPGSQGAEKKNSGDTFQTFLPSQHEDRAALLLLNGAVYTSWTSHCDAGPYTSWVIGYNETNLAQTTVLNLVPNGSEGGIWASGSGPQADAAGNVYLPIGNGTFDTQLNGSGFPVSGDYGNGYVRMTTSGGKLAVADYFTMSNTTSESNGDTDLGSGGGMLLPPLNDSGGHSRNLAVVAGKDSNIYVMDRTNLGKFNPNTDEIYQQLSGVLSGGVWSSPAWFNGTLYYGDQGNALKAFAFSNGLFGTSPSSQTSINLTYPGTTPSISANGTSNGIVWAYENSGPAVLHAYAASNLANELYNSNQAANGRDQFGDGNKFMVPTVVNGKVYVGTTNGVGVFGLLPLPLALQPPTANGQVDVAYSSTLVAAGGTPPYTFSISSGSLPSGLTLNASTGAITGTPTTAGKMSFTATVTDSRSPTPQTANSNASINIAATVGPILKINGNSTELSGVTNGSIVKPSIAPSGFNGTVVSKGAGSVNFRSAQGGNGVYFLSCCSNTNNAYFKFTGATIGNIFTMSQGSISFSLVSRYTFAQRKTTAASARSAFDVRDGNGTHLFYFLTQIVSKRLVFTYAAVGVGAYYYAPTGTEDALFGNGVSLNITLTWSGKTLQLYLNDSLVKSVPFTATTPNWTAASNFDFGAYEYLTFGGYKSLDDVISEFTVSMP
jgi:hypothetical protein